MTLITRLSRLFKADIHAVLDNIEEPELLLRQAIREMEDELSRQEQAIRLAAHEQAQCGARQRELENRLVDIEEELDLCFASGKDELARGLVRRKLETRRLAKQLAARQESIGKGLVRHEAQVADNRASLDSLRQKADLIDIRSPDGKADDDRGVSCRMDREPIVTEDEIEVAFLRERHSRKLS